MLLAHKLAIVIPAYKIEFFEQTLQSIANQTCKDFTLYIGDDASSNNLLKIIIPYYDKINIVYKRFNENIGGKDLIAHWSRCIDMLKDEEWIWLFSDDDLMDHNCVELFYKHISKNKDQSFVHFNLQIINDENVILYKTISFENHISTMDFYSKRLKNQLRSCAVEYIFKRDIFEKSNRFESFDLAWASDDATWLKLSVYGGINTIGGCFVKWRQSKINISQMSDRNTLLRKLNATIEYIKWSKRFFYQNKIVDISTEFEKANYLLGIIVHTSSLNYREKLNLVHYTIRNLNFNEITLNIVLQWILLEVKEKIKKIIKYNSLLKIQAHNEVF